MRFAALAFVVSTGLLYAAISLALVLIFTPAPHSDWMLYWSSAGDLSAYERGGVGWWLLALPKGLGIPPAISAWALNLVAGLGVLWLAWRVDTGRLRFRAALAGAFLCLLAPFAGLVQLDLVAAAFVAVALVLAVRAVSTPGGRGLWWAAGACLAAGVSTKPQYALLAWTMVLLLAMPAWAWRRRAPWGPTLVLVLLAGATVGFGLDQLHRMAGDRGEALRTRSAVTLYAGLLVSASRQEPGARPCGYWSAEATAAAAADLGKPLPVAIRDRLAARPPAHWWAVVRCKLPEVLRPPAFALGWLLQSPSVHADSALAGQIAQARMQAALRAERWLYGATTLLVLGSLTLAALQAGFRRLRFGALLPLAWMAAFWSVHLVFEIQGRYFLGLFLLAPFVCALALARPPGMRSTGSVE